MGRKTRELTRDLKTRRKALLERYDAEELHQLRVDIRRLRSVLKLAGTDGARRLPGGRPRTPGASWRSCAPAP